MYYETTEENADNLSSYSLSEEAPHGSSYLYLFHNGADRNDLYDIARDFYYGRDFDHFKTKYVDEQDPAGPQINYKSLFTPSPYGLRFLINEYLDHVKVLKNLKGLQTPLTDIEQERLTKFFELNNWNDLFKSIVRNRRIFGDDYIYLRISNAIPGFEKMPILTRLEPESVVIARNPKTKDIEYIYQKEKTEVVRSEINPLATELKTENIQLVFMKGKVVPYVNNEVETEKILYLPKGFETVNPILHFQFLKSDGSQYSVIPALDFIDSIIRLHRIETDIAETNSKSGAPQVWIVDGNTDPKSKFGARGIAYVDTTMEAKRSGKQATVTQKEITNGLESLYKEQGTVLNALFSSANLISPSIKELLSKSDSSKVIKYLSTDLIEELRLAYEEISEKTKPIWKMLFPNRTNEDIALEVPLDLYNSSLYDKATYINANVMTLREMYREQGKTEEEINQILIETNEQIQLLKGNGYNNMVPMVDETAKSILKNNDSLEAFQGLSPDVATSYNTKQGRI